MRAERNGCRKNHLAKGSIESVHTVQGLDFYYAYQVLTRLEGTCESARTTKKYGCDVKMNRQTSRFRELYIDGYLMVYGSENLTSVLVII